MYNRYIPVPAEDQWEPAAPPGGSAPPGGFSLPFLTGENGLSGLLRALKLDDLDAGDLLMLLIVLLLLSEGDNLELAIALGLVLVLGLGDGTQEGKKPSPRRREGGPEGAG